jgi:hypothetical protein
MTRAGNAVLGCLAAILALLLPCGAAAAEDAPWKQVARTGDGIVVHLRERPGTTVKEARASLRIAAPPRIVLDAACDPKSFGKSLKYVERHRYYWIGDPDVWFTWQLLNYPVVTRRDYVLRYQRTMDPARGIYRLSWATSTQKGPSPREDVVRVTLATGGIDIVPEGGGERSRLTFRLLADPGGNIPGWVIDIANRLSLPDIVREIRTAALLRARQCAQGDCRHWDAVGHDP